MRKTDVLNTRRFSKFKKFVSWSVFRELQLTQISLIIAWCRKLSTAAPGNFLNWTDQSFDKFLSITPDWVTHQAKIMLWVSGFSSNFFFFECNLWYSLNWAFFCSLTSRSCTSIEMLGMTLIGLPLSEFVVVSEFVDNVPLWWGQMCILWSWDLRTFIAVCRSDIAIVVVYVAT